MQSDIATARDVLISPSAFLASKIDLGAMGPILVAYERTWHAWGQQVSDLVDRMGTPHVRMFDELGRRIDAVLYPPDYYRLLREGYRAGVVWRTFDEGSLASSFLLGYLTSFFDAGLYCPYTVSLSTACPVDKYGDAALKSQVLEPLLRRDDTVWQGATWMTEARGGSDLGAAVETRARRVADGSWRLDGDKYFCSNADADVAVVAARPDDAPAGVRGLALFVVPRRRRDGSLNHALRRLKDKIGTRSVPTGEIELRDSEAWLLGRADQGVYLILEVLNVSRVANSIGCAALTQRALADAVAFASERVAFGKPIAEHPLLARQIEERSRRLDECWALAWGAVRHLDEVWREVPPYSDRYWLFRLVAHLAKYWTAEVAVQTAKWAMEVLGGAGTLAENRTERWLREAMICAIWEGTPHRQMLDALETMERKRTHHLLLDAMARWVAGREIADWRARLDAHLELPRDRREADLEPIFGDLAQFLARTLAAHGLRTRG
jgi:alkylation response protein AidB-like acyl-CoA dehydrogenase